MEPIREGTIFYFALVSELAEVFGGGGFWVGGERGGRTRRVELHTRPMKLLD